MEGTVTVSLRELLEAGAHFGHQKKRWHPLMKPYVYGLRGGVFIVDLQKTVRLFEEAMQLLTNLAAEGKTVLFVGTKRQAQEIIRQQAERCEMYYIHNRWLGGILTNWSTVKKSVDKLRDLENVETDERFAHLTKKERLKLMKRRERLSRVLEGIKEMTRRPDAMFVVDTAREHIAVAEANKLGIPVIGIVDTNADPTVVDYPIPANDDAIRSIELLLSRAADAVLEGRRRYVSSRPERTPRGRRRPAARAEKDGAAAKPAETVITVTAPEPGKPAASDAPQQPEESAAAEKPAASAAPEKPAASAAAEKPAEAGESSKPAGEES